MADHAEQLIAELAYAPWPLPREAEARELVSRRRAFRTQDKEALSSFADWNDPERKYLADPLPKQIAKAHSDFLYGEEPTYSLKIKAEQEHLDEILEENTYTAKLRRAARQVVSEGERWWKLHVNPEIAQVPLIDWHSRLDVVPLFYGERILACAFVTEVCRETLNEEDAASATTSVWRHFEVHIKGRVENVLFRGTEDSIGEQVSLELQPSTEDLAPVWQHDLPMLAGRVVNDIDEDAYLGESDYDQIEDFFLMLNEGITIASENARLTGKDRVFVDGRFIREDGSLDSGVEVFRRESDGGTLGDADSRPPVVAIEKHYDSEALWFHIVKVTTVALSRAGIVAQLVGEDTDKTGQGDSGVSIRLKFLPTTNASEGKGAEWDAENPKILRCMMLLSALAPSTQEGIPGGFGKPYSDTDAPGVERADTLPADETERVTRTATAVTAEIKSRWQGIKDLNPEWTDAEVDAEYARIRDEVGMDDGAEDDQPPVDPAEPPAEK